MSDNFKDNWKMAGYLFGHIIYIDADEYEVRDGGAPRHYSAWRFAKDGKLRDDVDCSTLECPKCGKTETSEGHDPCIANLPGVAFACCGHGVDGPYVKFENGDCYYDEDAVREIKKLRKDWSMS